MAAPTQAIAPEVRDKFMQMREDIKKLTNTLQDVESQQSEYTYATLRYLCGKDPYVPLESHFSLPPASSRFTAWYRCPVQLYALYQH